MSKSDYMAPQNLHLFVTIQNMTKMKNMIQILTIHWFVTIMKIITKTIRKYPTS